MRNAAARRPKPRSWRDMSVRELLAHYGLGDEVAGIPDDAELEAVFGNPETHDVPPIVLVGGDDYQAALAASRRDKTEETIPGDVVKRLAEGEHPVKVWRQHRKLTLQVLGAKADLAVGYLSDIENGKRAGTVATWRSIAAALDVDVDSLTAWLE